jgi:hypothetical protein
LVLPLTRMESSHDREASRKFKKVGGLSEEKREAADATPRPEGAIACLKGPSATNVLICAALARASGKKSAELDTSVYSALRPELEHC